MSRVSLADWLRGSALRVRRFSPVRKVIAVGAVVIVLILAITTSLAVRRYHAELGDAARELRTLDMLLAKDTGRSLQSVALLLDAIAEQLARTGSDPQAVGGARGGSEDMHQLLRTRVAGLPQLDAVSIVAADGRLVNFSRAWPVPPIQLGDRDYFKVLRDRPRDAPYLTEPVINRGTGTPTIYIAKRLSGPDGSFQGLLLGAVELSYFTRLYESLGLDPGNFIALSRDDGAVLASNLDWVRGLRASPG